MSRFFFEITQRVSTTKARLGRLTTPHGTIDTPAFIFCATKAALKGLSADQLRETGASIILSNTYHMMIQPGEDCVARQGGLHNFMGWQGPMLTDSGGFQVFSLGHGSVADEIKRRTPGTGRTPNQIKITEEGALFTSYRDGRRYLLSPERSIQVQHQLGADLIVVLDECTPFHVDRSYTERSMHLSHRWGKRSLNEFERLGAGNKQALYGIIQGGVYEDLRRESADFVNSLPFFGHAIGGSLGENQGQMDHVVDTTRRYLDEARPIHLLGIGKVRDVFTYVRHGIDTFDCVHPTRLGRHGGALIQTHYWDTAQEPFHPREHINLNKACFREDPAPIDEHCPCATCRTYSRAYLHHLLKAGEILALSALTLHNVTYMVRLMAAIRNAIREDRLDEEQAKWIAPSI